jgi:protein-disulfide isomerase
MFSIDAAAATATTATPDFDTGGAVFLVLARFYEPCWDPRAASSGTGPGRGEGRTRIFNHVSLLRSPMTSRRSLLAGVGAGLAATTLAGCLGLGGNSGGQGTPVEPDGTVGAAPLPEGESTYARMGSGGPVVTYYGNWKCPFCAEFSTGSDRVYSMGDLVTEYVEPGDLTMEYRAVAYIDGSPFLGADAPRAAQAGLSVWNRDRESYWSYHEYVMANQPPEGQQWATTDRLVEFAEAVGVEDTAGLRGDVESEAYEAAVRANTEPFVAAFKDQQPGTPTVVVDGTAYSPFQPEQFREALDSLVG